MAEVIGASCYPSLTVRTPNGPGVAPAHPATDVIAPTESFERAEAARQVQTPTAAPPKGFGDHLGEIISPHTTKHVMEHALHGPPTDPGSDFLIAGAHQAEEKALDPFLKRNGPGAALTLGLFMACAIAGSVFNTGCTYAADRAPGSSVSIVKGDQGDMVELARSYGLNPTVLEKVIEKGDLGKVLSVLPKEMREMYRNLSTEHKKFMNEKLQGSSGFLFIQVSNKEAFIKGEAAGYNTFDEMQKMLKKKLQSREVDQSLAAKLSRSIETFRGMSLAQRAAMVGLLEADMAALKD